MMGASGRAALLILALMGAAMASEAEDRAKELYENGAILYTEGRYEDAIVAWDEAYRLSQRSQLLFNIANAQERLARWRDALETLNRYRAYAPADQRDALDRRIANLERRLAEFEATAAPIDSPRSTSQTDPTVDELFAVEQVGPSHGGRTKSDFPVLPVTLLASGGVLAITGTVFALQAGSARGNAGDACVDSGGLVRCPDTVRTDLKRDKVSSILADTSWVLSAACLGVGTSILLLDAGQGVGGVHLRVLPGGASLSGAF